MIPGEIPAETLQLPECDDHSIVIISFNALRHERFAYRMKQEFGDKVVRWYRLNNACARRNPATAASSAAPAGKKQKLLEIARQARKGQRSPGYFGLAAALARSIRQKVDWQLFGRESRRAEQQIFGPELARLKATVELEPVDLHPGDVNTEWFLDEVRAINPYFFLSLGGPLYKKALLDSIRGCAINQHAGHSPDFKGTHTTEWALFRRDLSKVSSTVHITTSGADAGPILRRSNPCIFPDDTPASIFLRVAALGTEMMIETVHSIINDKTLLTFPQDPTDGMTYIGKNMPPHLLRSVMRDFSNGWLEDELMRRSRF